MQTPRRDRTKTMRTPIRKLCNSDIHLGRGDDTVGNPHRAQASQFELFEPILLLKLDKQSPVEQFEATVSQSTVPFPPSESIHYNIASVHPFIRPSLHLCQYVCLSTPYIMLWYVMLYYIIL